MPDQLNIDVLVEKAKNSADKEAYSLLHKTSNYRIGVGVRVSPDPSFFIETIVALTDESKEVDLPRLERVLDALKTLKARGYSLAYEDDNCISCEATKQCQDLKEEYLSLKTLIKQVFG